MLGNEIVSCLDQKGPNNNTPLFPPQMQENIKDTERVWAHDTKENQLESHYKSMRNVHTLLKNG